ncbi:MAG: pyruvate dehydrogenase complex dihydrolipoamide acetyltransferase [Chlamydiales bacterium]
MAIITMPKLSPTMEKGVIVKWHKKEGDSIQEGDVLFEVATDKATVEYQAIDKGFLRQIIVAEGKEADLNDPVAIFTATKDESFDSYSKENQQSVSDEKKSEIPTQTIESPAKEEKSQLVSGAKFAPEPALTHYQFNWKEDSNVFASPLAKKLASEKNIDLASIKGSGPGGRVISKDVESGMPQAWSTFASKRIPTIAPGTYEEEEISPMRRAIGERLASSKTFIPHFYVQQMIDMAKIIDIRNGFKELGIKVTYNDFMLRAVALTLREHPQINSGFNSIDQKIIRFKTIDIAIAVSVPDGLFTPIVRHADYKDLGQLAAEVKTLVNLAHNNKLSPEQYRGGSFTISNLGMFGIENFQAVINPPQAAILAVGGMGDHIFVREDRMVPSKVIRVSLSADHRVIDGVDAAKFLDSLRQFLENPAILLL